MFFRRKPTPTQPTDAAPAGSHRYVFVSGHPRSGTNWVSSLLNLHPGCFCDGEFHFFLIRRGVDAFKSQRWHLGAQPCQREIAEQNFRDTVRRCLLTRAEQQLGPAGRAVPMVLGDHSPCPFRPILAADEASYVIVERDGRDVLISYTFHMLNTGQASLLRQGPQEFFARQIKSLDGSSDSRRRAAVSLLGHEPWVRHCAHRWARLTLRDRVQSDLAASRATGHRVMRIAYERLHAQTDAVRTELYRHVGLDPAAAAPLSAETNTSPGFAGRDDPTNFLRRGQVGDWRRHFARQTGEWFQAAAGHALKQLGYEADDAWVRSLPPELPAIEIRSREHPLQKAC